VPTLWNGGRVSIRSDRRYRFDADCVDVWNAVTHVERYRDWWPWLEQFDGTTFDEGSTWHCVVKPRLPYRLHFDIALHDVVDGESARAELHGDIRGSAQISLADVEHGCELRLRSELEASNGMARVFDRWMPSVASLGHDWVIDTGARQFRSAALGT
jgi:hypothetical protein